ncbi:hypothetical protein PVK64_02020 [Aliivibrio sp. S4TY2]|uniref:hypothetical protein n=1 Tax=unclassified Aliivibrio TaxID=2645654 RepID=UPI002378270A|nr:MULTISPECIES: hypothetical protein [unclassified Aliivibrio]MDD9154969.1 hypothetical protein [Aliivibrio sp. S4TY2]MDD9158668.1 hypothetical protein [Aliivibrio sp. S4TY1]MDD9162972.1 hypothetical protein [Aliivibrio sp. S4MY2]MDD9166667.1 hypothetical protein [Aliivibrio sp. S4MY4]MDD9184049.1 hypothetical protein [Aliivibrio sp. S4MY3]
MQTLKFNDTEYSRVFCGKSCTIRLGNKTSNYTLGIAKLENVDSYEQCGNYGVDIHTITFTKISHVTEGMIDGELVININQLLERLSGIYNCEINSDSFVTVIQFDKPFELKEQQIHKKEEDKIIIPSDLNDEEYKDFLDVNFEQCPQCAEYLHDDEYTHDCEIKPKIGGLFYKPKEHDGSTISEAHCED